MFRGRKLGPKVIGTHGAQVDDQLRARARAFVATVGVVKARELLHIGADALDAACNRGSVMRTTSDRLRISLDREEPLLAQRAAS